MQGSKSSLINCSCMAFTNSDITGEGSGCVMWFGDLFDLKQLQTGDQDLYIRIYLCNSFILVFLLFSFSVFTDF